MATTIQTQNYGVEIELTGITREKAAQVIAEHYGTQATYLGTYYRTHGATDRKGRTWKCMSDASIQCQKKVRGQLTSAGSEYSCEVVTPILQYDDMEDLQEIVGSHRQQLHRNPRPCGRSKPYTGIHDPPRELLRGPPGSLLRSP